SPHLRGHSPTFSLPLFPFFRDDRGGGRAGIALALPSGTVPGGLMRSLSSLASNDETVDLVSPPRGRTRLKLCRSCGDTQSPEETACPGCGRALPALTLLAYPPGFRIREKYQIVKILGHGAMGMVYQARHLLLERE